jgi:hypothetical protein
VTFLESFFGNGNAIGWATVQESASETHRRLQPFLSAVEKGADLAFLPRSLPDSRQIRWYFLCHDAATGRRAMELMKAFLGPTFVLIEDQLNVLDAADGVDASVLQHYGRHSFWVTVPSRWPDGSPIADTPREVVRRRLESLSKLLAQRPVRSVARRRPVGRVFRDFEFAVTSGDSETAQGCLAELAATGDLTAANAKFLSVRIAGMRQDWDNILDPERLSEVLDLAPPRAIVQVLIEAVYSRYLQTLDDPGKAVDALAAFRRLRAVHGRLFRSRSGLSGRAVDFCFMLELVAFSEQPWPAVEAILNATPEGAPGREVLVAVARLAPPRAPAPAEVPPLIRAFERYQEGNLDDALALALPQPHGFGRTRLLVLIAAELRTLDAARAALEAIGRSEPDELDRFALLGPALRELRNLAEPEAGVSLPASWFEWLERLGKSPQWHGAVAAAAAGESGWDAREIVSADGIDRFTALVSASRQPWAERAFRDAVPYLVRAIGAARQGPALRPLHESLFLQLVTDPEVSSPQWNALADLTEAQAVYGLDGNSYVQQVDELAKLLQPLSSVRMVVPALAFLEALCDAPCPSPESRIRFVTELQAMLTSLHGKVPRSDVVLFAALARLTGVDVPSPAPESVPGMPGDLTALRGKTVALYSLNKSALQRAQTTLLAEVPEMLVKCFSDTRGGGPALAQAAKTADLFVVATAAATHSATGFIDQHRGAAPKRRVHRQGAAALVDEVRKFAEELESAA